ncbi:MAG: hypothetical protein C3F06_10655 [Candidatus Methanoperedenaceae archaeon]|nr:MAG: hypothetical protein C3F06_10655 [Candidatus Methanoperedenaceae archaeon]
MINSPPIKIISNLLIKTLLIAFFVSIAAGQADVQADGGYIARIDIAGNSNTEHWLGFYGVINNNTMIIRNSDAKNESAVFTSISPQAGDYLLITTSPSPPSVLQAGNIASVDEITGWGDDSGSNTFTHPSNYRIPYSNAILTDVPSIYIFDSMNHYFREALFSDSSGNPVFAVPIEDLRNTSSNFQFMLPDNGNIRYYFFYNVG